MKDKFYEQQLSLGDGLLNMLRDEITKLISEIEEKLISTPKYYSIKKLCQEFEVSRPTVNKWVSQYGLKRICVGDRVYFLQSDVDNFLNTKREYDE